MSLCPRPPRPVVALFLLGAIGCASTTIAAEFVRIEKVELDELHSVPFRLRRDVTVHVEAEGAGDPEHGDLYAYGWILDRRSRQVVWQLDTDESGRGPGTNYSWKGDLQLPAGDYTAYFAPFTQHYRTIHLFGKDLARIYIKRDGKKPRESKRWGLRLAVDDALVTAVEVQHDPPPVEDVRRFVDLTPMGNDAFESHGFRLPERMRITVYCQGEFADRDRGAVDGGCIMDAETREVVWEFGPDNFKHGGGDSKNKVSREIITLPAGAYVASYATDDSHSHDSWNAPPPHDPDGWGMMLTADSEAQAARIGKYTDADDAARTLVSLIRIGDGRTASIGLTLRKPTRLRVYCIGEHGGHEFVDYGQIDHFGGDNLWSMTEANTRHAGGAQKNRIADEMVQFAPGDYVVSYVTDDSHAWGAWNASPPCDARRWGISLMSPVDLGANDFKTFDPASRSEEGKDTLARLVRVRNSQHLRQRFTMAKPGRVHILALGEGMYSEMHDYGWIEAVPSGQWVWEMTMRNTRHAGGAEKNRIFNGTIMLDAGEYEVHYVTDDSHAWNQWNEEKPTRYDNWGISITPDAR